MIDFIKEYGVSNLDFEYIMHNLKSDVIELMCLSEDNIRKNLKFYNDMGITGDLAKIIMTRPDLIVNDFKNLKSMFDNVDKELFINIVKTSIEDLVLIGI